MRTNSKITVLTHRLGPNYGGVMQAYALQHYLRDNFTEKVCTGHRHPEANLAMRIASSVVGSIRRRKMYINSHNIKSIIESKPANFVEQHICYLGYISSTHLADTSTIISGSDQVWRAAYVDPLDYMFGFIQDDSIRRISYAASFGVDDLSEYSNRQIERAKGLMGRFSGVSVREKSAVALCGEQFEISALWHLDPVFLLEPDHYSNLIDKAKTAKVTAEILSYLLDTQNTKQEIASKISKKSSMRLFSVMPKKYNSYIDFLKNKDSYIMPSVEEWLRSFRDAKFVVTDSFHGVAFAIIFNKPFVAIGNKKRGLARFESLLELFDLKDRLVFSADDITNELLNEKINWKKINSKISSERTRSLRYLKKHLS